jgi:hypothetical protein
MGEHDAAAGKTPLGTIFVRRPWPGLREWAAQQAVAVEPKL